MRCEGPNSRLYTFVGNLELQQGPGQGGGHGVKPQALSPSSVLLRGCRLKNTGCIYGLVIYAGGWVWVGGCCCWWRADRNDLGIYAGRVSALFMFCVPTLCMGLCMYGTL